MIKRKFNQSIPHNKLRLHASERNTPFDDLFKEYKKSLTERDIRYYPNTESLNSLIKKFYNYNHFLMGFGSDRCIKYFFEAHSKKHWFWGNKRLITTNPSFPMYKVYSDMFGLNYREIDYNIIKFPTKELLQEIDSNSIIVFSNPSSPIGDLVSREDIIKILKLGLPTLIDEAYIEFSNTESCIDLIDKYDNLYVTRTLSKAYGSAGVRFGIIFSQEKNIKKLEQYRDMYEISGPTLKWVSILLQNKKQLKQYIKNVKETRRDLMFGLYNKEIFLIPSESNWIHVKESDLPELPNNIVFRKNCSIPHRGDNWIRLQITDNIRDYDWILK